MRRYTKIEINNVDFILNKEIAGFKHTGRFGKITDAYGKPSPAKIESFLDWMVWFKSNNGELGVHSKNTYTYTILGYVEDDTTHKLYEIFITPTKRYAFEIN